MTDRRTFIGLTAGSLLATSRLASAQPVQRTWRIGYLTGGARPPDGAVPAALRKALGELGYVEGRNAEYFGRWAEAKRDRIPALAAELVGLNVDLIVTFGFASSIVATRATATIPIVFIGTADPVATGLVTSLARPGGNLTGFSDQSDQLSAKRLEFLKEAIPGAAHVAVLWNADDLAMTLRYREIERAANALRVTIQPLGVREPDDFEVAFAAMDRQRPDALMLVTDALTNLNRKRVFEYATAHRIPAMYERGEMVREGGLMSYGPDVDDLMRGAAIYVDRIFKGTKPGDLPVEQPTRYFLWLNLGTAKALGLTIPPPLLLRADEVIP